jgi:hypothetical protein
MTDPALRSRHGGMRGEGGEGSSRLLADGTKKFI